MAKRKVYWVEKRSSKAGWKVKTQGGKVVAKTDTKAQAVKGATAVASKDKQASVVIRKANGQIQGAHLSSVKRPAQVEGLMIRGVTRSIDQASGHRLRDTIEMRPGRFVGVRPTEVIGVVRREQGRASGAQASTAGVLRADIRAQFIIGGLHR